MTKKSKTRGRKSQFTKAQVRSIRRRWESGKATQTEMAQQYGVSSAYICLICNGKRLANVD